MELGLVVVLTEGLSRLELRMAAIVAYLVSKVKTAHLLAHRTFEIDVV